MAYGDRLLPIPQYSDDRATASVYIHKRTNALIASRRARALFAALRLEMDQFFRT